MATHKLTGTFVQILYSPKGEVEGLLAQVDGEIVQFVLGKDDEAAASVVGQLGAGQVLSLTGDLLPPSSKGHGEHPVRSLAKIHSVDGAKPLAKPTTAPGYAGKIVRFNYARHGAPNGFVLDSGDFIHVKPDGFARLDLKVGDELSADGDAQFLSTGGGWAVEARSVNGRPSGSQSADQTGIGEHRPGIRLSQQVAASVVVGSCSPTRSTADCRPR